MTARATSDRGRSPVEAIRCATRAAHAQLDAQHRSYDWLGDRRRYAAFLVATAAAHRDVEAVVGHCEVTSRTGYGPKSELVAADLAILAGPGDPCPLPPETSGGATTSDAVARRDDQLASLRELAADIDGTLGLLYVIEGSTLGGRTICAEVRQRLSGRARDATTFLDPYGQATTRRWRSTVMTINSEVVRPEHAAEAASMAFELFQSRLDEACRGGG